MPHATGAHPRARRSAPLLLRLSSLALAVVALAAISPALAQADTRPEIRARLQFASPGGVFDPAYWRYTSDWFVYPNIFNWLVRWVPGSGGYQLEPDLAESWEVSEDGTEYTFHLRRGVQFHRGFGEMTSDDVVFSFERQINDSSASFNPDLQIIESIEAVDDYTVVIRINEPNAAFMATVLAYRPGFIVSRAAVEEYGAEFAQRPVGTGAFVFEELSSSDEVVLSANDDYFRGAPQISRLIFAHIAEEQVAVAALQRNEFQIIWTRGNPEAIIALQADPNVTTESIVRPDSVRHLAFNPNFVPTQDLRVRRALAHALDKSVISQALPGLEIPAHAVFAGDIGEVPTYAYDPQLARQLLAEAGYPNGFAVTIMFQSRSPENILAELVAALWEDVGLTVTLESMEPTAAFDRRIAGTFEVTVLSVGRPADADLLFTDLFFSTSLPPGGSNQFKYAAIDDLILQGRRLSDTAQRAEVYHQAHIKVMEDLPIIPLSYQSFAAAWRAPVAGMVHGTANEFWGETIRTR